MTPYDHPRSKAYRESDNLSIQSKDHKYMCEMLQSISTSFDNEIVALDIGCGTGRNFHCLKNTKELLGIDESPFMLKEAEKPVLREKITIKNIELRAGNLLDIKLQENSFDFVYSLGVLGEHMIYDLFIAEEIYKLLKKGGKFYFSVVDRNSKLQNKSFKRKMVEFVYPVLPTSIKKKIDKRFHTFYMTGDELKDIMRNSHFNEYEINHFVSSSPKWTGAHYFCVASK